MHYILSFNLSKKIGSKLYSRKGNVDDLRMLTQAALS
jgi:hypothetical protein